MEFPPTEYDIFEANIFETARPRAAGGAVMEVMLQMRPKGRCLDHFRIGLTGQHMDTQVKVTNVFRAPILAKYRLTFQAWPRDLRIRRNMTITEWSDVYTSIAANNALMSMEETGENVLTEEIMAAFESIKEAHNKSASIRYAVVARTTRCGWNTSPCLPQRRPCKQSRPSSGKIFKQVS
jgi:hypothetical protein